MTTVVNVFATSATTENLSRHEMLMWVNDCLQAQFSKIEQLHTGAGYAQFTDFLFPGCINLKKIKWNSRLELDWLSNWKLVMTAWKSLGIEKVIPTDKLIKGKFQDNFEFLQWFKKFFDANYDGHEYNPLEARGGEVLPAEGGGKAPIASKMQAPTRSAAPSNMSRGPPSRNTSNGAINVAAARPKPAAAAPSRPHPQPHSRLGTNGHGIQKPSAASAGAARPTAANGAATAELMEKLEKMKLENEESNRQLAESDAVIQSLEKERDFYFSKLRSIEVMCQDNETIGTLEVGKLLDVLYETEEGFAPPEDENEP